MYQSRISHNQHIIHNINANVNCNTDNLLEVNDHDIAELIKSAIDELSTEFDELNDGQILSFSEISIIIDLEENQFHTLKNKIKDVLRNEVINSESNRKMSNQLSSSKKSKALSRIEVLLNFLRTGSLPWNVNEVVLCIDDFEKHNLQEQFILPLLNVLRVNSNAISRLVHQFSEDNIIELIKLMTSDQFASETSKLKNLLESTSKKYSKIYDLGFRLGALLFEEIFESLCLELNGDNKIQASYSSHENWNSILIGWVHKSVKFYPDLDVILFEEAIMETNSPYLISSIESIREIIESKSHSPISTKASGKDMNAIVKSEEEDRLEFEPQSELNFNPSKAKKDFQSKKISTNANGSINVSNAGIILLHPFLSSFFEKVGLIEKGLFISKLCQQRAVCLLHYIATGELEFEEQYLFFQKYICEYDIEESIPRNLPISQYEKDEVDKLLNAVLEHWKSLKGVSTQGLRGNYLIRNGVLQLDGIESIIHMEQKTADILLKQIPWTLNYAKWSWHSKLLTIKWS